MAFDMKDRAMNQEYYLMRESVRETVKPFLVTLIQLNILKHEVGQNATNRRNQTVLLNKLTTYWARKLRTEDKL